MSVTFFDVTCRHFSDGRDPFVVLSITRGGNHGELCTDVTLRQELSYTAAISLAQELLVNAAAAEPEWHKKSAKVVQARGAA